MFELPSSETSRQHEFREIQPPDPLVAAARSLADWTGRLLRRTPIRALRLYRYLGGKS